MKVSTEIDNNFGYEKITQLVDNILLNIFHDYSLAWKLKVNIDKTKIVCFTNGRLPQNLQFSILHIATAKLKL